MRLVLALRTGSETGRRAGGSRQRRMDESVDGRRLLKLYVMTDLEGPALVNRFDQTRGADPEIKHEAKRCLTGEINACVAGILQADPAADVIVWDGHGNGGINGIDLHPEARLIARGPIVPPYGLEATYDALFFVGQHARMGSGGVLCHTYSSRTIESFHINGVEMGEFGCRALLAGTLGIPAVFLSGDDVAVREAQALVPDLVGVAVKQALGRELALHLSHAKACERIRHGSAEAVSRTRRIPPYRLEPPYEQVVTLLPEGCRGWEKWLARGYEPTGPRTLRKCSDDLCRLHV